jgi:hypothetical protein
MTSFDFFNFFRIFGPQTIFIGGQGMEFKILDFLEFLNLRRYL